MQKFKFVIVVFRNVGQLEYKKIWINVIWVLNFQVSLDSFGMVSGIEIGAYSLESCRVCVGSFDTFHIFYYLVYGAPENWKLELQLQNFSFSVSSKNMFSNH